MGKKGLEPLTLRLSGAYSCLLSYLPLDGHVEHYQCIFNDGIAWPSIKPSNTIIKNALVIMLRVPVLLCD